ncbi:MAG: hypothetical protein JWN89_224 [Parcubacteria group bacterium]|nr:hypothetical protein [Parcubacteria group bacterium]
MEYRLIETEYRNRIEYEDGPGSLQNIVSDKRERILDRGTWSDESSTEDLIRYCVEYCIPHRRLEGPVGMYEYNYFLEYRKSSAVEWEYLASIYDVELDFEDDDPEE